MGLILPVLGVAVVLYFTIGAWVNYRKLSQFKGPPLAALSRSWLFYKTLNASLYAAEADAIAKYGTSTSICQPQVDPCRPR